MNRRVRDVIARQTLAAHWDLWLELAGEPEERSAYLAGAAAALTILSQRASLGGGGAARAADVHRLYDEIRALVGDEPPRRPRHAQ